MIQKVHSSTPIRILTLAGIALLLIIPLRLLERSSKASSLPLMPHFSHPSGYYDDTFLLEIDAPPDATILFTLDGRFPTPQTANRYTQPILMSRETAVIIIRARAILANGDATPVVTATYFIGVQSTLPLLSLVVDTEDLYNPETGIFANPTEHGREWERPAVISYIEPNRLAPSQPINWQAVVGLRINGASSRQAAKKSWRVYFRQAYGQNRLEYPLFDDQFSSFKRLIIHNGGQDASNAFGTLLRPHLLSILADEMGLVTSQTQPVLLFVNGRSEGIYLIRNRMDEWFLADKYGIQILPEAEAAAQWDKLSQFVESHDLTDPDNYAYITTQIDLDNLIDYYILQIYAANTDWIFTNVRNFKPDTQGGRFQWLIWDMDWTFGLANQSGPDFNMMAWFETNDRPGFAANSLLIRKLWQNETFQHRFLTRTDELLNTTLEGEKVAAQIDELAAALRPNMTHELGRWPRIKDWETNVDFMRDFALQRPFHMRQHLINYFEQSPETLPELK